MSQGGSDAASRNFWAPEVQLLSNLVGKGLYLLRMHAPHVKNQMG